MPWRVFLIFCTGVPLVFLWGLLVVMTSPRMPYPLWFVLVLAEVWLIDAIYERLYARWLFAQLALASGQGSPGEPNL